jgi:hypothetical protein
MWLPAPAAPMIVSPPTGSWIRPATVSRGRADGSAAHCQRADHRVLAAGHALLDVVQHRLHGVALQPFLAAAQVAGDDRERHCLGELRQVGLGAIGSGRSTITSPSSLSSFGGIAASLAAVEQVHEEGLEDVLAMVAEHQRRAPLLPRDAVEMAAPQPRAQRAIGLALRQLVGDDRIGVLILDAVRERRWRSASPAGCAWESSAGPGRDCRRAARPAAARAI